MATLLTKIRKVIPIIDITHEILSNILSYFFFFSKEREQRKSFIILSQFTRKFVVSYEITFYRRENILH